MVRVASDGLVLDSSAIVAIHLRQPGHEQLIEKIDAAPVIVVGVPTVLEALMVLTARIGQDARLMVFAFLRRIQSEMVPLNEEHLNAAVTAFLLFSRDRHPAALNFADCMSYAVASISDMPLLFTGKDFTRTDISPA